MNLLEIWGRFVVKYSKPLLIIYVILGILLIPMSQEAVKRISSAQESFLPENAESMQAEQILSSEFPKSEISGIVIVLRNISGSVINYRTYQIVKNISSWILKNIWFASSISDYYQTVELLFNYSKATYQKFLSLINVTDEIIWGTPYQFAKIWETIFNKYGKVDVSDYEAFLEVNKSIILRVSTLYNEFREYLKDLLNKDKLIALTKLYVEGFYQAWLFARNSSYNQTLLPPNGFSPMLAANIIAKLYISNITDYISSFDQKFAKIVEIIGNELDIYSWQDIGAVIDSAVVYINETVGLSSYEKIFVSAFYRELIGRFTNFTNIIWWIFKGDRFPLIFPKNVYLSARSSYVSADNDTMIIIVNVNASEGLPEEELAKDPIKNLRLYLKSFEDSELEIFTTGVVPFHVDNTLGAREDVERIDIVTFVVAFLLLVAIFRGLPVAILPIVLMGVTVIVSRVLIVFLADITNLTISDLTLALSTTAIIGAGVDYTVFLLFRYREEREKGKGIDEAILEVVNHAGKSILLSGGTVVIAFGALTLSSFKLLKNVGLGVMTGISVALLISLSLTPAILSIFGDKIFWPSKITKRTSVAKMSKSIEKLVKWVSRNGVLVLILSLLITIPAYIAYMNIGTTYDFMKLARRDSPSKIGYIVLRNEIGSQAYSTIEIVAVYDESLPFVVNNTLNITALNIYVLPIYEVLLNIEGIKWVKGPYNPYLIFINESTGLDYILSVYAAIINYISRDLSSIRFLVSIYGDPYTKEAFKVVEEIRNRLKKIAESGINGVRVKFFVGGLSAMYRDIATIVTNDFKFLTVLVIAGIITLLTIALKSILIPIRLEITILLSILWAIAINMFLWILFESLKLAWFIPLFLFTVLNGLGMDYDVFLVTRIEEEKFVRGLDDLDSIIEAVKATAKVITVAGIIMASAFASLLIARSPPTQQIGSALAIGVLIDALIIRIILVPAIMVIAGKWNWWPREKTNT